MARRNVWKQEVQVGIVCFLLISLIAVAVYGDDSVGIFVYYDSVRVHAECTNVIFKFLCTVDDLALVQLVGEVGEHLIGQLHPHADIHTVGAGGDLQRRADLLHPLLPPAATEMTQVRPS